MPAWGEGVFAVLSEGLGKVGTCWGQAQAWGRESGQSWSGCPGSGWMPPPPDRCPLPPAPVSPLGVLPRGGCGQAQLSACSSRHGLSRPTKSFWTA